MFYKVKNLKLTSYREWVLGLIWWAIRDSNP